MKRQILPLVLASMAATGVYAEGPIDGELYGKIFLSLENQELDVPGTGNDVDEWELKTNASRIGVQGKSELNDSLNVIYKIEWEIDATGDDNRDLRTRNRYVGLTGDFGTVIAGKHDTPLKMAQNKIDLFNDLTGDIKETFAGENRINDIVMYTSPTIAGFAASVAFSTDQGEEQVGTNEADDLADGISLALTYTLDDLLFAVAIDQDVVSDDPTVSNFSPLIGANDEFLMDIIRLVAQWSPGDFQLGFMYQQAEDSETVDIVDQDGIFVSGQYKLGKHVFKAQYGMTEDDAQLKNDFEATTLSLGYDQKLGKNTKWFAFFTKNEDESGIFDTEETVFGVGMEHKF